MALRDRLPRHDTIGQLERARLDRLDESLILAKSGRRHTAIYLLGYFVEMTLKTVFFRCFGVRSDDPIERKDLKAAAQLAREELRVAEDPYGFHNPVFWMRAIVSLRHSLDNPMSDSVSRELAWRSQRLNKHWTVSMRYVRDLALLEDWSCVKEDAFWIHANYNALVATGDDL